jgi:hypothetical protein
MTVTAPVQRQTALPSRLPTPRMARRAHLFALARRIAHLRGMRASTPLSTVCHPPTQTTRISDRDVTIAVRWGATYDCLMAKEYTVDRVSSHSLCAGGAMAMKLSGATDSTIMRIGRWTSLTYLTYIHSQIEAQLTGVACICPNNSHSKTLNDWGRPKESSPLGHPRPHTDPGAALEISRDAQFGVALTLPDVR